jgi:hypothetical protein
VAEALSQEPVATAFFNGTGEYFLNILPRNRPMDTRHFAEEIVSGLEDVCYPKERNPHERKMAVLFDDASIYNTKKVMKPLEQSRFKNMDHPDLAPCNFFLVS